MIDVCMTLDLDVDCYDIMEGEEVLGMGFIHPFPVVSAAGWWLQRWNWFEQGGGSCG